MKLKYIYLCIALVSTNIHAQLIDFVTGLTDPNYMILDGDNLYVSQLGSIVVIDINASNPTPTELFGNLNEVSGLALQGTTLYFGDFNSGTIFMADISQSNPTIQTFASGLGSPNFIRINGNYLYCAETQGDQIVRYDLNSSNPVQELVASVNIPIGLAFDGNDLYYTGISPSQILKKDISDLSNPSEVIIDSGLTNPNAIELIGNELYIPDFNPDTLYKIDINDNPSTLTTVIDNIDGPKHAIQVGTDLFIVIKNENKIAYIDDILSVPDFERESSAIKVYPNPSSDVIQLTRNTPVKFELLTITGQSVMKGTFFPNQQVSIAHLQKGLYILNFEGGTSRKLIKN